MNRIFTLGRIAAFLATIFEFYSFSLFGFLSVFIAQNYLRSESALNSIILSFSIFATGWIARPIGGAFFGWIADRFTRRLSLLLTIACMLLSTIIIGLLPFYNTMIFLSVCLIGLSRVIQGLSVGGEFSIAALFVIERSKEGSRFFHGSLLTVSSVIGMTCVMF